MLLDHPRLVHQLVSLERRVSRFGRDSVNHPNGANDDAANAAAGALVLAEHDRQPGLIRADALMPSGRPAPVPDVADMLFAVLHLGDNATVAITYWVQNFYTQPSLFLADFDLQPLAPRIFADADARLDELAVACRVRREIVVFGPGQLASAGWGTPRTEWLPDNLLADPQRVALAAAAFVGDGRVAITTTAAERARRHPLGAALDFRLHEAADGAHPLRSALLLGIVQALGVEW